ncbi:hypothetical protein Dimus_029578 [Dionaea muscipula]
MAPPLQYQPECRRIDSDTYGIDVETCDPGNFVVEAGKQESSCWLLIDFGGKRKPSPVYHCRGLGVPHLLPIDKRQRHSSSTNERDVTPVAGNDPSPPTSATTGERSKNSLAIAMCPLRLILVFFSAILAGYFAWRSLCSSPEENDAAATITSKDSNVQQAAVSLKKNCEERSLKKMARDGFWVLVDMASGRFLWRNFKQMRKDDEEKSS